MWSKWRSAVLVGVVVVTAGCERRVGDLAAPKAEKQVEKPAAEKAVVAGLKGAKLKMVKLETSLGDIVIELDEKKAPVTVANFLRYVEEGFYDGTIFHRVISGFMIQGGMYTADMKSRNTHEAIVNEASNGLKNARGAIAMARTNNPNSARSQFFINHKDNDFLNYAGPAKPGYAVFGRVVEGMDVVDAIAAVKTAVRRGMRDVPVEPVVITSAVIVSADR